MSNRKLLNIELGRVSPQQYKDLPESGLVLVLDNIRSAHNVGSAFRSGDSFKVDKVWLCGICACPPSAEIHKTALGAEDSLPWEWVEDTLEAVRRLKAEGYTVVAAEQTAESVMVDECDFCLEIPQFGTKHSLNVSVSIGVMLWHFRLHISL